MSDFSHDDELRSTEAHVAHLARSVSADPRHKANLRQELLRRHHELAFERTQRSNRWYWPRFTRLKRLTLLAPPALAAAVAMSAVIWGLQVTGHSSSQAAEAQRLTAALSHNVTSVTSWTGTLSQETANAASTSHLPLWTLDKYQRVYVEQRPDGLYHTYIYSHGQWLEPTATGFRGRSTNAWQFAFAVVPSGLPRGSTQILSGTQRIGGFTTKAVQYHLVAEKGIAVRGTAWVDIKTGLTVRLSRVLVRGRTVVERDVATYQYGVNGR